MADEDAGPSIVAASRERERGGVSSAPKHRDAHPGGLGPTVAHSFRGRAVGNSRT